SGARLRALEPAAQASVESIRLTLVVGDRADAGGLGHDDDVRVYVHDGVPLELRGPATTCAEIEGDRRPDADALRRLDRRRPVHGYLSARVPVPSFSLA